MTDSERKHGLYGEPWTIYEGDANGRKYFIQGADAETEFGRIIAGMDFRGDDYLSRTDVWCRMRRAAQCVNACEGIDDPTAELTRLRARIEELEECGESAIAFARDRAEKAERRVKELERVVDYGRSFHVEFERWRSCYATDLKKTYKLADSFKDELSALDAAEGEK